MSGPVWKEEKKCHTSPLRAFFFYARRGPWWEKWPLKTARDYYPSSPLLFVLVQWAAAALGMLLSLSLSLSPQSCITNNGLTCVPLINTSANKLASHTSILVWGRLISGAHTGFEHMCRSHGTVEAPANYQTSDGPFLFFFPPFPLLPPPFDWELDLLPPRAASRKTGLFFVEALLGGAQSGGGDDRASALCLVSQYLGYQGEQIDSSKAKVWMSMNITTCNLCRKIFFVISAGERGYSKKKKRKEGRKKKIKQKAPDKWKVNCIQSQILEALRSLTQRERTACQGD